MTIIEGIENLKAEYKEKVRLQDVKLAHLKPQITKARRSGDSNLRRLSKERAIEDARLVAYNQAYHDIDSLIDFMEVDSGLTGSDIVADA